MVTISKQQWNERFGKLPLPIRAVLMNPDTQLADQVSVICQRHDLDDMQIATVTRLTSYLLMGFLLPTEFIKEVGDGIDVPRDKAILITQDLNRDIFNDVKDYLKEVHAKVISPAAPIRTEKPQNVPTGTLQPTGLPLPPRPPGAPIRSDWGWHGVRNKVTGEIEYKHESVQPDALMKRAMPQGSTAGTAHVGSIFEQKLGGAFRMKGETVSYEGVAPVAPAVPKKPGLHVPHKPIELKIPPAQATEPPK